MFVATDQTLLATAAFFLLLVNFAVISARVLCCTGAVEDVEAGVPRSRIEQPRLYFRETIHVYIKGIFLPHVDSVDILSGKYVSYMKASGRVRNSPW